VQPIRVLVADDHAIVRKGICALLDTEPGIEVVGEAENGREAIRQAQKAHPDVVLMDLMMPVVDGCEATRQISASLPSVQVLVLTSFGSDHNLFPAIKAGAAGYLLKDTGPQELSRAIRQVSRGESSLHPIVARKLLHAISEPDNKGGHLECLTDRETEVLQLIAQGHSNQGISEALTISVATVRTHVSSILSKLGLTSRTQAALYALREGVASLDGLDVPGPQ
jgi:NarL family two-component system response regulator LiaR